MESTARTFQLLPIRFEGAPPSAHLLPLTDDGAESHLRFHTPQWDLCPFSHPRRPLLVNQLAYARACFMPGRDPDLGGPSAGVNTDS